MSLQEHIRSNRRTGSLEFFIEERKDDSVTSRMPITPGMLNPFGTIQAGALIWLADVTATVLAIGSQTIGEEGKGFPLAIDLHTTLVGNQREGEIRAEAGFVRRGRKVLVIRTRLTGTGGRLLAEVTSTHVKAE